jgi:hypothetical protein
MQNLEYELRKCKECSCSRCSLNGTSGCYIEIAIKELNRYDQAFDSMKNDENVLESTRAYYADMCEFLNKKG